MAFNRLVEVVGSMVNEEIGEKEGSEPSDVSMKMESFSPGSPEVLDYGGGGLSVEVHGDKGRDVHELIVDAAGSGDAVGDGQVETSKDVAGDAESDVSDHSDLKL